MKFGERITGARQEKFGDCYVDYKLIKTEMKRESEGLITADAFVELFLGEMNRVAKLYLAHEGALIASVSAELEAGSISMMLNQSPDALSGPLQLLQRVCEMEELGNWAFQALWKAVKKHDKICKAKIFNRVMPLVSNQPFVLTRNLLKVKTIIMDLMEDTAL
jgi:SPX domain protein involved in polyphosphate accumulation